MIYPMKKNEAVYERVKTRISQGAIRPGERLPSVREEAASSGVSVNTVLTAYDRLVDEGWLRTRARSGYFARRRANLSEGIGIPLPDHFVSAAREAGERLDLVFERLTRIDSSFAIASPGRDLLPTRRLGDSFGRLRSSWIEYADPSGDAVLRKRIALATEESDGSADPRDILVTNGATEAMSLALTALVNPGDTVVLESPTYYNYFRQLAPLGVNIVEVPVGPDGIDLDILENELAARSIRAIIVQPNVQNPTGVTMSDAAKARLVSIASDRGAILIQDDVYGDLSFGLRRPRNLRAFGDYSGLVFISSFSKSVAPGLRVGWIQAPAYTDRIAEIKLRFSMDTCRAAQGILAGFVGSKDHRRHLAALRSALEHRIDEHIDCLARVLPKGSSIQRPSGGCLLWIRLPEGTDASRVFERSAGNGCIAAPGELFSSNPFFRNYIRVNAGWKLDAEREKSLSWLGRLE